jgi:predicted dehydrogenase
MPSISNIFKRKSTTPSAGPAPNGISNGTSNSDPQPAENGEDNQFLRAVGKQNFASPPRILVIGAGSRGSAYARSTQVSTNAVIAAVCEPVAYKRGEFGRKFIWGDSQPTPGQQFEGWQQWVEFENARRAKEKAGEEVERGIDAVFVCVLDEMHEEVVCGIAGLGVHVCCEKPMSTSLKSCVNIYNALRDGEKAGMNGHANGHINGNTTTETKRKGQGTVFGICHVLRYSPHNMLLRQLVLEKDVIGDVLSIEHVEPVGNWHFSHSYVR